MKTNNKNILQNTSFEQLIKTNLLENSDDKFNNKAIEMNANYIFSQPSQVELTQQKLESLIQQHQLGFSKIFALIRFLIHWIAPAIILLSMGYYANNKFNKEPQQKMLPPVTDELKRDSTVVEKLPTKTIEQLPVNVHKKDLDFEKATKKEKKSKKKLSSTTYRALPAPMPKVRMYNPDLYEAPAPKFEMEASPEDFALKVKAYYLYPSSSFSFNNKPLFANYYSGTPFKSGMEDFVFINNADLINHNTRSLYYLSPKAIPTDFYPGSNQYNELIFVPISLKYHLDKYEVNDKKKLVIDKLSKKELDLLLKPFYFSKYEVSVKEYKEFTNWVLESNGFDKFQNVYEADPNDSKRQSFDNYNKSINNNKTYFVKWKVDPQKAFNYVFNNPSKKTLDALKENAINIAPSDAIFSPMDDDYPYIEFELNPFYIKYDAYFDYAIVGVSYYQALAFLDWKTHFHQEQLDNEGIEYDIEYTLPNSLERRMVIDPSEMFSDENWICDLNTTKTKKTNLDHIINNYGIYGSYIKPSVIFPVSNKDKSYKYNSLQRHSLINGVVWLDGNVSEWMADTYTKNWQGVFGAHKKQLEDTDADMLSSLIEDFYNKSNHPNGQLIMGGNYLDNRFGKIEMHFGKVDMSFNKVGTYLKKYVDPHQQYSTVGFRYIIKVRDAEEAKKERLLEMIGSFDYDKYKDFPEAYMDDFKRFDNGKYILDKEVTNGMWRSFLMDLLTNGREEEALVCIPKSDLWTKYNEDYIYYFRELKYDELPVVNISQEAAQLFNKWMTDKFNSYALRKYGKVEFVLPSEKEWEKAASGRLNNIKFSWGGPYARNYKGCKIANFKMLPYIKDFYPSEQGTTKADSSYANNKYDIVSDSLRIPHYEAFDKGEISYPTFRDLDDDYWMRKSKISILTIKDIKKLKKEKKSDCNYSKGDGLFLFEKGVYFSNDIGVYDIYGNVAEMVEDSNLVKGGSWNSYSELATIAKSEPWNAKASPMVGFRPVLRILYKGFDHDTKVKAQAIPPGTVLLNPNYGVDKTEITNVDYREYMYYTMQMYGKESREYQSIAPDTAVWYCDSRAQKALETATMASGDSTVLDGIYLTERDSLLTFDNKPRGDLYLRHPAYKNYPLVGVSHTQAKSFCVWRSERVNEFYAIYHAKNPNDRTIPKHVTYRLPSPKEWDSIQVTDSLFNGKTYEKPNLGFQTKAIEHYSSHPSDYGSPNKIGLYGLNDNVSEMTSEEGIAKGEHWAQKYLKQSGKDIKYTKPESWIGVRCVVDVEY